MKLTKAASGIARGDVSNHAIRNILTETSVRTYGKIIEEDIVQAMDFFDCKCPYTGKPLKDAMGNDGTHDNVIDHIVPQNKDCCGLNVKGNLVLVDRAANNKKGSKTVEDFLLHDDTVLHGVSMDERKARLAKIKEFQKKFGYDPDEIRRNLSPYLCKIYDGIGKEQDKRITEAIAIAGLPLPSPVGFHRARSGKTGTRLRFDPENEALFKKKFLANKRARIELKYDSGVTKQCFWNAVGSAADSNLEANIQSRPWWRTRNKDGLVEVTVSIL